MLFLAEENEILHDIALDITKWYFYVHFYVVSFSSPYYFKWDLFLSKSSYVLIMIK